MSDRTSGQGFGDDVELRRLNRATVEKYMEFIEGEKRLQRHELFTEDGSAGLWTTDTGEPIVMTGIERLKEHAAWSLQCLPDWVWFNIEIFETQDPNRFWVECDGKGQIIFPGYPIGHYANHFLHYFELENGKIKKNREFMNPCVQLRALGIEVPTIKREGIPAD